MGALSRVMVQMLPLVPRAIVGRVSARYIAGERLPEALAAVRRLRDAGLQASVDVLGEFVHRLDEAARARDEYLALLSALGGDGMRAQVSVKLTQLGLKLDRDVCAEHVRGLVRRAEQLRTLVTIDMEDSSCTDATLEVLGTVRRESPHVGGVLQACLRRSAADLDRLLPLRPNLRICKGIYVEPVEIAYRDREEVRRSFIHLVDRLLGSEGFVGIATHDEVLVEACRELLRRHHAGPDRYEFQMLLGVREELRARVRAEGHPVRVYVPYGTHWYAYSMRRLKENPAIAGLVLRNLFERVH
jgi:proline dehydrogenase